MVLDLVNLEDYGILYNDCTSTLSSPEDLYKEFHTNMSQFREPPPYPGPPKQTNQSGLRQSFSGSETSTDVSLSSTENLSSSQRQEPQGEETQVQQTCHTYDLSNTSDSDYSILARLGMSTTGLELKPQNTPEIYVTGNTNVTLPNVHGPHFATTPMSSAYMSLPHAPPAPNSFYVSSESGISSASTSSSKLTIPDTGSNQNVSLNNSSGYSYNRSPNPPQRQPMANNFSSPNSVSSYNSSTIYANYPQWAGSGAMDPLQLAQSPQFPNSPQMGGSPMGSQIGYPMAQHMFQQYITNLPPPPQYPGSHTQDSLDQPEGARRSYEVLGKHEIPGSRSQPDLTYLHDQSKYFGMLKNAGSGSENEYGSQKSLEQMLQEQPHLSGIDQIAMQATEMVTVLTEENATLRQKSDIYEKKVLKLQKFEIEIQKLHESYEALNRSSKKREYLEAMMRKKYEEDIKTLKAVNMSLIGQLEEAGVPVPEKVTLSCVDPVDSSMANLLAKHKELLILKERQDMELDALKATVQEQRAQIDILRNVQVNSAKFEESQRQQILADYDEQIQEELASIKAAYEKKEQTEKQIRQKLERDVELCRQHHSKQHVSAMQGKSDGKQELSSDVRRILDEKEGKILQLEKELIKWKEQHLEESIRKLKLQESEGELTPRLPQYEQAIGGGLNTETLINEAKADKLKQMEEVYQAKRTVAELEASVKSLQSQLSEKESILRIYQRSPMTRSSSVHTIFCTPQHSPRPSLIATGSLSRQGSQDAGSLLEVRHKKTGSTSALEAYSLASQDDLFEKIQSLKSESNSESDSNESSGTVWQV